MLVIFPINLSLSLSFSLSDPTQVCDGVGFSRNAYLNKPIRTSKPLCLSNVCLISVFISGNFYVSKAVSPKSIKSSRSIRASDACQIRSNVSPGKRVRPSDVCIIKTVHPSNLF